jgi:predicted ArsR family transcriptional regulator
MTSVVSTGRPRYGRPMPPSHLPGPDGATPLHRALSSEPRSRLLGYLQDAPEPVGLEALSAHLGLHVNTVRSHLDVLQETGLVEATPEARDRPGRPRMLYRTTDRGAGVRTTGEDGYRFLAGVLAGYLAANVPDAAAAAEEAGEAWGRYVADRPAPWAAPDPDADVDRVVGLLERLGFAPRRADGPTGPQVELRRCPFLDVAREHEEVVCALHLGILRGALGAMDSPVRAADLRPFVAPGLCVADLEDTGS